MITDRLIHAMAADNQLRCVAAVTTELVGEACRRHRTFPTASAALGRTLTGGLLLGSGVKDLEKLTVHFDCDGPIGDIIAQADPLGNVRGYVSNPQADATAMNERGKLDVRAVVGGGKLYITRDAGFEIGLIEGAVSRDGTDRIRRDRRRYRLLSREIRAGPLGGQPWRADDH